MSMSKISIPAKTWTSIGVVMPCVLYCEHDIRLFHGAAAPTNPLDGIPMQTSHRGNHPVLGWSSADEVFIYSNEATDITISRA